MNEKTVLKNSLKAHSDSWCSEKAVKFYKNYRNSVDEVNDSEKYFLVQLVKSEFSVLDLGSVGGFYQVFKNFEPTVEYTRNDFSGEMIRNA